MQLSFSELKELFARHLEEKQKQQGSSYEPDDFDVDNVSIFTHFSEFKQFLVSNNYADSSIFSKSIEDIQNMRFDEESGKFTTEEQDKTNQPYQQDNQDDNVSVDDNFMADLLNDLFSEEEVISNLDTNGSNDLDIDEITAFLSEHADESETGDSVLDFENLEEPVQCIYLLDSIYTDEESIKYLDLDGDGILSDYEKAKFVAYVKGDKDDLTYADLQAAYEAIKEGNFSLEDYLKSDFEYEGETDDGIKPSEEVQKTIAQTPASSIPSSGSGYSSAGTSSALPSDEPLNQLEIATLDELKKMKADKESEISQTQRAIEAAQKDADSEIEALEGDEKRSQNQYKESLKNDSKLNENQKELIEAITTSQAQVSLVKNQKEALTQNLTSQQDSVNNTASYLDSLKGSLSNLPAKGSDSHPEDASKASELEAYRSSLNSKIAAAQKRLDDEKKALADLQKQLEDNQETLETAQGALSKLEEQFKTEFGHEPTQENITALMSETTKGAYEKWLEDNKALEEAKCGKSGKAKELQELKETLKTQHRA